MPKMRIKLGELLKGEGLITDEQVQKALVDQKTKGGQMGEALVRLGFVKEEDMVRVLGKQLGMQYLSKGKGLLKPDRTNKELLRAIPEGFAKDHIVLPISLTMNSLTVAFADPLDIMTMDNLKRVTGRDINPVVATKTDLLSAIDEFYGGKVADSKAGPPVAEGGVITEEGLDLDKVLSEAGEPSVIKTVDAIITQGVEKGASDIHIEPFEGKINLRYRIDGVLHNMPPPSKKMLLPIVSRVKIMSKMDIAEKRLPQDGAIGMQVGGKSIEMRVSTVPTVYGEKIVIRIMDASRVALDLEGLGFDDAQLKLFKEASEKPFGLIFLTGPTGSGKSTTLYATLSQLRSPRRNIITIEDPVEFKVDGINQVQARSDIGLTFSAGLRAFLRQDPDVMMVGEVRDLDTAQICVRAALTGHLVLSTLHTNTAPGAVTRLVNIGVEPYLIASSLIMVVAQRLVRRLCAKCKAECKPDKDKLDGIKLSAEDKFFRAVGCPECAQTGYRGRVAIHEIMVINNKLKELITKNASTHILTQVARESGMMSLRESGMTKVKQGMTSLEEILSITYEDEG
ncbi:MAG: Flp pilus assembly complex ATPase component TadA [Candidatus Omnitrophica bacterium]|nr:Flp pilus assembly complex ATPase component TadA [Candidatus Omnitrophota bacterium]